MSRKGESMRRAAGWALTAGVAVVLLCATNAHAMYHPTAGRFIQRDPIGYRREAGLYVYGACNPQRHADPTGLEPSPVRGNAYGNWQINQQDKDCGAPDPWFPDAGEDDPLTVHGTSITHIWFFPDPKTACCDEIGFVQAYRITDTKTGRPLDLTGQPLDAASGDGGRAGQGSSGVEAGWGLDNGGSNLGWYGYESSGKVMRYGIPKGSRDPLTGLRKVDVFDRVVPGSAPDPLKAAELQDEPSAARRNTKFSFQTCAVCYKGKDEGKNCGCLRWGLEIDGQGKVTSPNAESGSPDANFDAVVREWNTNAGAKSGKVPFPPFR